MALNDKTLPGFGLNMSVPAPEQAICIFLRSKNFRVLMPYQKFVKHLSLPAVCPFLDYKIYIHDPKTNEFQMPFL